MSVYRQKTVSAWDSSQCELTNQGAVPFQSGLPASSGVLLTQDLGKELAEVKEELSCTQKQLFDVNSLAANY
jgi:hypothetical protein